MFALPVVLCVTLEEADWVPLVDTEGLALLLLEALEVQLLLALLLSLTEELED